MVMNVVILGGGFAGILAARRIAAAVRDEALVVLVSAMDTFRERVRFHELAAGREIPSWPIEQLIAGSGARLVCTTARAIDLGNRRIVGADCAIDYDVLVYAPGSMVDLASVPGVAEHATSVTDEASSRQLAAAVRELPDGATVCVCGGGMTGVEVATELVEAFPRLRVELVSRDPICEPLAPRARRYLDAALARRNITVVTDATVREVRAGEVVLDRETRRFALCIWAASFVPSPLARAAGLAVHPRGQLEVDDTLRSTSHPEVFGAGDAALPTCAAPIRMGCATAMPMAAQAAHNVVAHVRGRRLRAFRFAYIARFISLGRSDALAQITRADDSPRRFVMTGRLAAWLKDLTFRFNVFALRTGFYPWRLALVSAPRSALPSATKDPGAPTG
jgi:NADH dehydrogenase FAD-containing subunit